MRKPFAARNEQWNVYLKGKIKIDFFSHKSEVHSKYSEIEQNSSFLTKGWKVVYHRNVNAHSLQCTVPDTEFFQLK